MSDCTFQTDKPLYKIDVLLGHRELQTRLATGTDGLFYGQGRKRDVSQDGIAGQWSEWEDTGVVLYFPEPERPRPWWKFWGWCNEQK